MNDQLFNAISKGDVHIVEKIVREAIGSNIPIENILNESMIPAVREIGEKFSKNEVYVPEMLICSRAMQAGLEILEPYIIKSGRREKGKIAIGTVKGDLHSIGKNLVAMMLRGAGYQVHDLGINCDVNKFSSAVKAGINVIMCSSLLTTTAPYMKVIFDYFKQYPEVVVVIGGGAIDKMFADSIGAAHYGENANDAVGIADAIFSQS